MLKSKEIINIAKKRYEALSHKWYDWTSFYNGFLEGYFEDGINKPLTTEDIEIIDEGYYQYGWIKKKPHISAQSETIEELLIKLNKLNK